MARSNIEIARAAKMKPIAEIAGKIGIPETALFSYGPYKAKIGFEFLDGLAARPDGKLILVTAVTPNATGVGKTKTTIGLNDALNRLGKRSLAALREPSLGPCFGIKGGACGGGYSQIVPMDEINLHFTGDFHAISAANNLLAAMIDNHVFWGNALGLDTRRISFRRAVDINDRALRSIVNSLGGSNNGYPREDGFDITVATETMAIFCLAENRKDLEERLGAIVVGETRGRKPVRAAAFDAVGSMSVLLRDALMPNLVQSIENNPVLVHGGPFANIAHGCNSVIATKAALKLADYVVTEAGFGADLGAEKFFDIKCRKAGLRPAAAVVVATIRAMKHHGGVAKDDLPKENTAAVAEGCANLVCHVENMRKFGVPVVVAINNYPTDSAAEISEVQKAAAALGASAVVCTDWAEGSEGAVDLARAVLDLADHGGADFKPLYPDAMTLWDKADTIAREIYRAVGIAADPTVKKRFDELQNAGFGHLPICMAKTQYSFSTDPALLGAPKGHEVKIRELRLSAGAGFVVAIAGEILTMPGLPRVPAAHAIRLNEAGEIEGLF